MGRTNYNCRYRETQECAGAHRTDEGECSEQLLRVSRVLVHLQQRRELAALEQHFRLPNLLHLQHTQQQKFSRGADQVMYSIAVLPCQGTVQRSLSTQCHVK